MGTSDPVDQRPKISCTSASLMNICLRSTFRRRTYGLKLCSSRDTKSWSFFVGFRCSRLTKHISEADALCSRVRVKTVLANREGEHRVRIGGMALRSRGCRRGLRALPLSEEPASELDITGTWRSCGSVCDCWTASIVCDWWT